MQINGTSVIPGFNNTPITQGLPLLAPTEVQPLVFPSAEPAEGAPPQDISTLTAGEKSTLALPPIRVDRNGDGVESAVEQRLANGVRRARETMAQQDQDGNGQLEGTEVNDALKAADRNNDGIITVRELSRFNNRHISREERFQGFDSNGDGVLSGQELARKKWAKGRDKNGDGQVTRDEFVQGRKGRKSKLSPTPPPTDGVPTTAPSPSAPTTAPSPSAPGTASGDVFASARLDRQKPPSVSWYRPHRQNEAPTLRISGNVTSENFWREVALASMNVGMSPRRMATVLQDALPTALQGLGVNLDSAGRAQLAQMIRQRTAGLPRANPIPPALHPDTTHKYLDDNPAAAGWRDRYGPMFDRMLQRGG
jgi:hypothetical protein